jgi:hypothetical protein
VVECVSLCELGEFLPLAFASSLLIFFDELFPDVMLDEAIVFEGYLPFLHVVLIQF